MIQKRIKLNIIFISLMLLLNPIMAKEIIETYQLNNGLNVILLNDNSAKIVTIKAIVGVGSIYEEEYLGTGISHYLEHIVAGGSTEKASEDSYKQDLSLMGGVSNAYTTTDHTAYFINTTPEKTKQAIKTLYEWLFYCNFQEKEVIREKSVITREIEKTYTNIHRQFYYLSQENTYLNHPSQFPVIGFLEKFKTLTKDDLKRFYKRNYVASNITLIVGGPISIQNTKDTINQTFSNEKKLPKPIFTNTSEPLPFNPRKITQEIDMNSTLISLRFPTVDLYSSDLYALDLLDYILGNGNQSILTKKLVEELKIAYSVRTSSYTPAYTKGYFEIMIDTDQKHIQKAINETLSIIKTSKKKSFSKKRIERSKKQKLAENILNVTSIEDKTTKLAMSFLYSQTPNFFDIYTNNFKQLTAYDVKNAANEFLNENYLITTIGIPKVSNSEKKEDQSIQNKEKPKKITLKNGLRIILHPSNQLKSTKLQIITKAGILAETKNNNGIGNLTAKLLGTSTNKYNKEDIETIIENKGASMHANSGYHTLYYTLDCLAEDTNTLAPLFFHTFFEATFQDTYIFEEKRKQTNIIKQRNDDWFSHASYKFKKKFWADHPYSLSSLGELDSIKKLDSKTFTTFHQSLLNPKNIIISIMGNYEKKKLINQIEKIRFNTKNPLQSQSDIPNKEKKKTTHLNHKFETTSLFMGFKGISLLNIEEKVKLDIIDTLLSGASYPGGRLHNKLRDKGYVYVVHGINFNGINTGSFYIYALTNETSWENVEKHILEEIKSLQEKPVSNKEWDEAIARLKFYYKDRMSSSDSLILIQAANELLLNDMNHNDKIETIIDSISKEMIMKAAKIYLTNPETIIFHPKQNS